MTSRTEGRLSIVVPMFNEAQTIGQVIRAIKEANLDPYELIVVDDGSSDASFLVAERALDKSDTLLRHNENRGKSEALKTGAEVATGQWIIVQDADLEYDPNEIHKLLDATRDGHAVVYGRRPSFWNRPGRWLFALGVLGVDMALLFIYRRWVRDHASCYKLMPRLVYNSLHLESKGFEGCVEITAKLMRKGMRIHQTPIRYAPRGFADGKKLTATYGFLALRTVWQYRNWKSANKLSQDIHNRH